MTFDSDCDGSDFDYDAVVLVFGRPHNHGDPLFYPELWIPIRRFSNCARLNMFITHWVGSLPKADS